MNIGDIVIKIMKKHNQYAIDVGCNSMFLDIYDELDKKPKYAFEQWKSNVIYRLQKDERFKCEKTMYGLRNHKINIVELKEINNK